MNAPFDHDLSPDRFAIGQSVPRTEDPVLLRGEGRYTDDLSLPGQLYGVMVRSTVAHGRLVALHMDEARSMPGVRAVLTVADLKAAGIKPMQGNVTGANRDGRPSPKPVQYALAEHRVRYVGDPIAMVVADTQKQARDAAEAIFAEIETLPAVTDARAADAPGAPLLHDDAPGNLVLDFHYGDTPGPSTETLAAPATRAPNRLADQRQHRGARAALPGGPVSL